jgi:hypothetical protein
MTVYGHAAIDGQNASLAYFRKRKCPAVARCAAESKQYLARGILAIGVRLSL